MAVPERTRQPLPDPALKALEVGHDHDEPPARLYHAKMLGDNGGRVVKVLDQAGRIDQVKGIRAE